MGVYGRLWAIIFSHLYGHGRRRDKAILQYFVPALDRKDEFKGTDIIILIFGIVFSQTSTKDHLCVSTDLYGEMDETIINRQHSLLAFWVCIWSPWQWRHGASWSISHEPRGDQLRWDRHIYSKLDGWSCLIINTLKWAHFNLPISTVLILWPTLRLHEANVMQICYNCVYK